MENLLVYQHVPHEHPGRFAELARARGIHIDTVKVWEEYETPDSSKYSRLLVMGGPQSAYDSPENYPSKELELRTIRTFTEAGKPVLGICLGSQLIARAFGGNVYRNMVNGRPYKETGIYGTRLTEEGKSNPLFNGFPSAFDVFHWHGDIFDLPGSADLLATGDVTNQAFVIPNSQTYGALFHLEVTPEMVEELVRVDNTWLHSNNEVDDKMLIGNFRRKSESLRVFGERLFVNWLSLKIF